MINKQYYKYPRTYHMPWSEGLQNDDRRVENPDMFEGKEVIVTIKMDGENTTMYNDRIHARSLDSAYHPSRNYVKAIHGAIRHQIPDQWRVCGENLYAQHSIKYNNLISYFQVFSIWMSNTCLHWDDVMLYCGRWGLKPVRTLWRDIYDEDTIRTLGSEVMQNGFYGDPVEGYVIRVVDSFDYKDFSKNVAKVVRKNHVQTDQHWLKDWNETMVNKLKTW